VQVSDGLLTASALPTHLTPTAGGFAATAVRKAGGQSTASRPAAVPGPSPLPGRLVPAATLGSQRPWVRPAFVLISLFRLLDPGCPLPAHFKADE